MSNVADFKLTLEQVVCRRGWQDLFAPQSFEISNGEVVHLQGVNGSGKTTLLNVITGLSIPSEGQVLWNHQRLSRIQHDYIENLLYLGHQTGMKSSLSPLANLQFYHDEHRDVCYQALAHVDLDDYAHQLLDTLSAGQQRRVALARLMLTSASLWILDEPFTALDKKYCCQLEYDLSQHVKRGGAIVLTSHQPFILPDCQIKQVRLQTE